MNNLLKNKVGLSCFVSALIAFLLFAFLFIAGAYITLFTTTDKYGTRCDEDQIGFNF